MQFENKTIYNPHDFVNTLNVRFSLVAENIIGNNTSDIEYSVSQNFTLKKNEENRKI